MSIKASLKRKMCWQCLLATILVITLILNITVTASAGILDDIGGFFEDVGGAIISPLNWAADSVGGLVTRSLGVNNTISQLTGAIEVAGDETQEAIVVAGAESRSVVRVAGYEAEQVADRMSAEAQEVLIVGSNEAQNVIHATGDEAENVMRVAGVEGRALVNEVGAETQEVVVVASREAQMVARVAGQEARATAAEIGAQAREVVLIASNESQKVIHLAGEEARSVVRTAGEEARQTLDRFYEQNERMVAVLSDAYQDNLDVTIDNLDEGSRRMLRNWEDSLQEVNQILVHDLFLVESSMIRVVGEASDETQETVQQMEASLKNVIITAGETTIYIVDRLTNNVLTIIAIVLTGLGILLLIYLFFVYRMPSGTSARFVYAFMTIYLLGFGSLIASPVARAYAMRSTQVGLRAELQKTARPEIVFSAIVSDGIGNGQPRVELLGRNLWTESARPKVMVGERPAPVNILSQARITIPLDEDALAAMRDSSVNLTLDYGKPGQNFVIALRLPDPLSARNDDALPIPSPEVKLSAISGNEVQLFAGPGEKTYSQLGVLPENLLYKVIGRNSEQTWWQISGVETPSGTGWVKDVLVELMGNPINVAVVESTAATVTPTPTLTPIATATPHVTPTKTPTPSPTPVPQVVVKETAVNVRVGDGTSYRAFGKGLAAGESAVLLALNPYGTWGKVMTSNGEGWVTLADQWVTTLGDIGTLPQENPVPILADDSLNIREDQEVQIDVLTNDQGNFKSDTLRVVRASQGQAYATNGNVLYQPQRDFYGSAQIVYEVCDELTCKQATVSINAVPINDAPSFRGGSSLSVWATMGPQRIRRWATDISPGPNNERTQSLQFLVVTDQARLFSKQPYIDPLSGDLYFTPNSSRSGVAKVYVILEDSGGNANGGVDRSERYVFEIIIRAFTP
jgi:uncharacterized protein YraI